MTKDKIKKALELCSKDEDCEKCPYVDHYCCTKALQKDALALITDYHRYKKGFEKACKLLSRYMDFEIPEIQEKLLSMAEEEL